MTLALRYAATTDAGRIREHNEDSGFAGPRILAVADGMGGMAYGELASALAIDTLRQFNPSATDDPLGALTDAAHEANARIAERIAADPRFEGMGTTLTAGVFLDDHLALAHIGDSRAYLLREGRLEQITHDHTFVQSLIDDGRLTPEEAARHPHRALITKALDGRHEATPDLTRVELHAADRLLFCSDGLDNADLDEDIITEILGQDASVTELAEQLVARALEAGSPDNVTCVVADVFDTDVDAEVPEEVVVVGAATELTSLDEKAVEVTSTDEAPLVEGAEPSAQDDAGEDEEDLRYAPQPPKRFRWLRRTALGLVILAFVGTGLWAAYTWTQAQYYVGAYAPGQEDAGQEDTAAEDAAGPGAEEPRRLAIHQGIAQQIPGLALSSPVDIRGLDLRLLPTYHRQLVESAISAEDLDEAHEIVTELERVAEKCQAEVEEQANNQGDEQPDDAEDEGDNQQRDNQRGGNAPTADGQRSPENTGRGQTDGQSGIAPEDNRSTDDARQANPSPTSEPQDEPTSHEPDWRYASGLDDIPLNCEGVAPDSGETR